MFRRLWKVEDDVVIYCNLEYDAVALNPQVYKDENGVLHNVIDVENSDGETEQNAIKYAFAFYLAPLKPGFKSQLIFFQTSDKGNCGKKQDETVALIVKHLRKHNILVRCEGYDGDRHLN